MPLVLAHVMHTLAELTLLLVVPVVIVAVWELRSRRRSSK